METVDDTQMNIYSLALWGKLIAVFAEKFQQLLQMLPSLQNFHLHGEAKLRRHIGFSA